MWEGVVRWGVAITRDQYRPTYPTPPRLSVLFHECRVCAVAAFNCSAFCNEYKSYATPLCRVTVTRNSGRVN